jgi:hypothetical protein
MRATFIKGTPPPTNCVYRFISYRQNRKPIPTYVGTVPETNLLLFLPDSISPTNFGTIPLFWRRGEMFCGVGKMCGCAGFITKAGLAILGLVYF